MEDFSKETRDNYDELDKIIEETLDQIKSEMDEKKLDRETLPIYEIVRGDSQFLIDMEYLRINCN